MYFCESVGAHSVWRAQYATVVSSADLEIIEQTLLVIAEARERAERVAKSLKRSDGGAVLVEALEKADKTLHDVHGEIMRAAYFPSRETQLSLSASV